MQAARVRLSVRQTFILFAAVLTAFLGMTTATATLARADTAPLQIDCGGPGGDGFLADNWSTGGVPVTKPADQPSLPNWIGGVTHPIPAHVWNDARSSEFDYRFQGLAPGNYELRLYFMDWQNSHAGDRVFTIQVGATTVGKNFDIVGTAIKKGADGRNAFGIEQDFPVTVGSEGLLEMAFHNGSRAADKAIVNAIAVVPVS